MVSPYLSSPSLVLAECRVALKMLFVSLRACVRSDVGDRL
jgi:hypothetical protein